MARRRVVVSAAIAGAVVVGSVSGYLVVHREAPAPRSYNVPAPTHFYETPATRRLRYQASKATAKTWGPARRIDNNMAAIHHAMAQHPGHGYQVRGPNADRWPHKRRRLRGAIKVMRHGLVNSGVGKVWRIRPGGISRFTWRSKKIDIDPMVAANTEGTPSIDIIVGSTFKHFQHQGLFIYGIYECRYILNTNLLSQHAYGNAVDLGGSTALLDRVARWQFDMAKKGYMPLAQLLWRGHDWFSGSGVYDHYGHIHDTGRPMMSGGCHQPLSRGGALPVPLPSGASWPYEGSEDIETNSTPSPSVTP